MQFYPADWSQDTKVLSLKAAGAWINLLCQMWIAPTPGKINWSMREFTTFLRLDNDHDINEMCTDLSRVGTVILTNTDAKKVKIGSKAAHIIIISRRIQRDWRRLKSLKAKHKRYNSKRNSTTELRPAKRPHNDPETTAKRPLEVRSQKSEVRSHISGEEAPPKSVARKDSEPESDPKIEAVDSATARQKLFAHAGGARRYLEKTPQEIEERRQLLAEQAESIQKNGKKGETDEKTETETEKEKAHKKASGDPASEIADGKEQV